MDATISIFKEYFRDIYNAGPSTCAGTCDAATPASLGQIAYEARRCCKSACSDPSVSSIDSCRDMFCETQCRAETLILQTDSLTKCLEICTLGCNKRFNPS